MVGIGADDLSYLTALRQTNILNTRLLVPRGPNKFMMLWTVFGRADDDEEMTRHRLRQNNIFDPRVSLASKTMKP